MAALEKSSFTPRSRLRTRVTLFFLLAAAPAILTSIGAVVVLDRLIQQEIDDRTRDGIRAVRAMVDEASARAVEEVARIAAAPAVRELVGAIDGNLERYEGLAANRAATSGLELLAFVAARGPTEGTVVSSAHLSSSVGDDGEPFLVAKDGSATRVGLVHVYVEGNPPELVPALVATRVIRGAGDQPALYVYGGVRLDGRRLEDLARLTRATLVLRSPGLSPRIYGAGDDSEDAETSRAQVIPVLPGGRKLTEPGLKASDRPTHLEVRVHTPRLLRARSLFLGLSGAMVAFSLLAAFAASTWLSKKIAEPIVALSSAAMDVASDNLDVHIEPRSDDEVGSLVRVFNHMTAELAESRDRLSRAERIAAWQQIARRVAHEIKNPLFPIQMSMETIKKSYDKQHPKLAEIIDESTRTVLEEVRSLNRIVTEFSDFARLPTPELEPTEVTVLLDHVYGLYRGDGSVLRYDKVAVASKSLGTVPADRDQLGRVLINLVKNAIEALPEAGGTVTLDAYKDRKRDRDGVVLVIADTGVGMPEEVRAKIFTPYFTTKSEGTGLGLAIVERIVNEHGGTIDLESSGQGTTFSVWLPQTA